MGCWLAPRRLVDHNRLFWCARKEGRRGNQRRVMWHRACRFTSEDDNSRDYYTFVEVDAFDRAACQSLCEALDGDTCRGFEYRSSTGACELWNVSPAFSAVADGRERRVSVLGRGACVVGGAGRITLWLWIGVVATALPREVAAVEDARER